MGEQLNLLKQATLDYLMGAAKRVYGMRGPRVVNNPDGIWVGDTPMPATRPPVSQRQQSMTFVAMLVQLAADNTVALGGTGTGAIAHPFTYTLKDYATGVTLKNADGTDATGLSPRFARQQFAVTTAATNGHACRDENGVWILDDCDEVYERCA